VVLERAIARLAAEELPARPADAGAGRGVAEARPALAGDQETGGTPCESDQASG
jgi:hypothetical protein